MVGQFVTGNYFTMLGVGASLGRTIGPDEERTASDVIVLSEAVVARLVWWRPADSRQDGARTRPAHGSHRRGAARIR